MSDIREQHMPFEARLRRLSIGRSTLRLPKRFVRVQFMRCMRLTFAASFAKALHGLFSQLATGLHIFRSFVAACSRMFPWKRSRKPHDFLCYGNLRSVNCLAMVASHRQAAMANAEQNGLQLLYHKGK